MLKVMPVIATLLASPAVAGPCGNPLDEAMLAVGEASAKMSVCDTDNTLTGPCSRAIIDDQKALDALERANTRCKAAIDLSNAAMEGRESPIIWSYDPPPPWRPE